MDTKQIIRRSMRASEQAHSEQYEQKCSASLCESLRATPEYQAADTVLVYMAMPHEVDLQMLLESDSKRFVIPRVVGDTLELREYSPEHLVAGYKNIMEPSDEAPLVSADEIDLAVIPGVAFDRQGNRLGHGKGFYDRLLAQLGCKTIGICFSYRLVDEVPSDPWDKPVDLVIC